MSKPKKSEFNKMPPEVRVMLVAFMLIVWIGAVLYVFSDLTTVATVITPLTIVPVGIAYARYTACQQATLKVMDEFSSARMLPGRALIRSLHDAVIAGKAQREVDIIIKCTEKAENFRIFAEYMENLAVGLKHQIYNLQMVEDWLGKDVRTYYDAAAPMIKIYRENLPSDGPKSQYKNFQALSDHFSNPENCRAIMPSINAKTMTDNNKTQTATIGSTMTDGEKAHIIAIIGIGIAIVAAIITVGGWLSTDIQAIRTELNQNRAEIHHEINNDIFEVRTDMRRMRIEMREDLDKAKADFGKNRDPEAPEAK